MLVLIAISISDVHPDPLGPDRIRARNVKLNQEWIEIENTGDEPFKLKGRVGPNDMSKIRPHFELSSSYDKDPKQEEIQFKLTLVHTHGEVKLNGTSKIRS